jgi:hypothetical protein
MNLIDSQQNPLHYGLSRLTFVKYRRFIGDRRGTSCRGGCEYHPLDRLLFGREVQPSQSSIHRRFNYGMVFVEGIICCLLSIN